MSEPKFKIGDKIIVSPKLVKENKLAFDFGLQSVVIGGLEGTFTIMTVFPQFSASWWLENRQVKYGYKINHKNKDLIFPECWLERVSLQLEFEF